MSHYILFASYYHRIELLILISTCRLCRHRQHVSCRCCSLAEESYTGCSFHIRSCCKAVVDEAAGGKSEASSLQPVSVRGIIWPTGLFLSLSFSRLWGGSAQKLEQTFEFSLELQCWGERKQTLQLMEGLWVSGESISQSLWFDAPAENWSYGWCLLRYLLFAVFIYVPLIAWFSGATFLLVQY